MSDRSRTGQRLEELLEARASQARPSSDAWQQIPDSTGGARGWRRLSAVAAVAVLAAAVVGVGQLMDDQAPRPSVVGVPTTSPTPTTGPSAPSTSTPTAEPTVAMPTFQQVPAWPESLALGEETRMRAVAASGGTFLSVGSRGSGGAAWRPTLRPWPVISNPSFEGPQVRLTGVTAPHVPEDGSTRPYVAVGHDLDRGLSWATTTGSGGRLQPVEGAGRLLDVAADGRTVVAAGETTDGAPAAFVSDDGTSWEAAPVPADGVDIPPRMGAPLHHVAHGPGGFVATGWPDSATGEPTPGYVWTSEDGRRWQRLDVASSGLPTDEAIVALTGTPGGYVAVTNDTGTVYRSPDGTSWQQTGTLPGSSGGPVKVGAIIGTRDGPARLVAVGDVCDQPQALDCEGAVWLGGDTGWHHRRVPGHGSPADVTRTDGGRIVVVGDAPCGQGCPADARRVATAWVTAPVAPGAPTPG